MQRINQIFRRKQFGLNLGKWLVGAILFLNISCAKTPNLGPQLDQFFSNSESETPVDSGSNQNSASYKYEALAWETASKVERKNWSSFVFSLLEKHWDRFSLVEDAGNFCPGFEALNKNEKINVLGQIIAGITFYESGWNPLSRMHEPTMGTDPVTGLPVYSEGLMQLSYQDTDWAPYCDFSWNVDKHLSETDSRKTILDPFKNLNCGIQILAAQIKRTGRLTLSSGVYWSVLKINGTYTKIPEIAKITKKLSLCQ